MLDRMTCNKSLWLFLFTLAAFCSHVIQVKADQVVIYGPSQDHEYINDVIDEDYYLIRANPTQDVSAGFTADALDDNGDPVEFSETPLITWSLSVADSNTYISPTIQTWGTTFFAAKRPPVTAYYTLSIVVIGIEWDGTPFYATNSVGITLEYNNVSITNITVDVLVGNPPPFSNSMNYQFQDLVTTTGTGLDQVQNRQLINSVTNLTNFVGAAETVAQVATDLGTGVAVNSGGWVVDTGWDWTALSCNNTNTIANNIDTQGGRTDPGTQTVSGVNYSTGKLASINRSFQIQCRDTNTGEIIYEQSWGYSWTNSPSRWGPADNPPVPAGVVCAGGPHNTPNAAGNGPAQFTNIDYITGLPAVAGKFP